MNSRFMILMLMGLLCAPAGAVEIEIEGVKLADTATVAGRDLVLNGAGLRKRLLFDVYVASLYLPAKVSAAAAVLKAEPRRVRIDREHPHHRQRCGEDADRGRGVQSCPAQDLARRPPRAGRPKDGDAGRLRAHQSRSHPPRQLAGPGQALQWHLMGPHGLSAAFTVDAGYRAFAVSAFMLFEAQRSR